MDLPDAVTVCLIQAGLMKDAFDDLPLLEHLAAQLSHSATTLRGLVYQERHKPIITATSVLTSHQLTRIPA